MSQTLTSAAVGVTIYSESAYLMLIVLCSHLPMDLDGTYCLVTQREI